MKLLKIVLFCAVIGLLSFGVIKIILEKKSTVKNYVELKAELDSLITENENLKSRMEYLQKPENLVKELKSELNYRAKNEKLIIIVPQTSSTEN